VEVSKIAGWCGTATGVGDRRTPSAGRDILHRVAGPNHERTEIVDVSSPVQEQRRGKAAQRAAAQKAAAERAARRRRTQAMLGAAGGVLAVVLVIAFAVFSSRSDSGDKTTAQPAEPPAATAPADQQPPPGPQQLPPGTDPALATKPKVTKGEGTLSKLVVTPLVPGKGEAVKAGQTLVVNYVGVSYTTGEEFDASWKRGQPFEVQIGTGGVIKGWDQGLVGVPVGSRVQLDIPSDLAYGDQAANGPSGPLRFVVDVLAAQ
jgi:peptidylprolyl isomerase